MAFHYPPIFAIAMIPQADPPLGESRAGMLPYPVTVSIWYVLSLVLLAAAVHLLASALERAGARLGGIPPPGSRPWWALRAIPVAIVLAPVGNTLSRGQSNFVELFALSAMIAAIVERRSIAAGLWLAGAVCIKVIPLYLPVYPIWRRDFRMLAACAVRLVLGLLLLPMACSEALRLSATSANGIACCPSPRWATAAIARAPRNYSISTVPTINRSSRSCTTGSISMKQSTCRVGAAPPRPNSICALFTTQRARFSRRSRCWRRVGVERNRASSKSGRRPRWSS
jgi:Glycosyltransferase family 87